MMRTWFVLAICSLLGLLRTASGSCTVALAQESFEAAQPNGGLLLFAVSGCSISAISASILQLPAISFAVKQTSIEALVTSSGRYTVSINENGVAVSGSPFSFEVTAGPAVAQNTAFYGLGALPAIAGQASTIHVVPRDLFGNNVSVASLNAVMADISTSAIAVISSTAGGFLSFSATRSGTYRLSVVFASSTSTFSVPVAAAAPDGSASVLKNAFIATAGVSSSFDILIRDRFGNLCVSPSDLSLSFSLHGISSTLGGALSTDATFQTSHSYISDSTYSVTFLTTRAAFYQINSMIGGRSGSSLLSGQVLNAFGCASLSFATSFPQTAVAGSSFSAVVQMVDEYGNQATHGAGSYKGFIGDTLCSTCPSVYLNGKASIEFLLTVSATFSLNVKIGETLVSGFPLQVVVSPIISGAPSSSLYSVAAPDVVAGGIPQSISFFLLDRFGNIRKESSEIIPQLSASPSGSEPGSQRLSAVVQAGGLYTVSVNSSSAFTVSGKYQASIFYANTPISTVGPSWNVQPTVPSATFSSKSGKGAYYSIVSAATTFSLTLKDKYANLVTQSGFSADVSLSPPFSFSVSEGPAGSGTVVVSYSANASGVVKMSCTVRGHNVIDSPSDIFVQASGFSASRSSFSSDRVVAVAGSSFSIDLTVSDALGNPWIVNPFSDSSDGNIVTDVKISGPSLFTPVTLRGSPSSSAFKVSALFTRSGQYTISADIVYTKPSQNGETLTLSGSTVPQVFIVGASSAVQKDLFLDGAGVSIGTAGLYSQFYIHTFDSFGNLRTNFSNSLGDNFLVAADVEAVSLSGSSIAAGIPGIRGQSDGSYAVIYRYTLAGRYKFSIRFRGELTSVTTEALLVPGFAFGSMSSVSLSSSTVTAGAPTTFIISAIDKYGNVRSTSGGGPISVSIPNVPSSVYEYSYKELGTGAYELKFIITKSGAFPVNLFLNDSPLGGNPFQVQVVPSFADPVHSTLVFTEKYAVTAGVPTLFDISSSDRYSNIKSVGGEVFWISASRVSSSHFEHEATPKVFNGTCSFSDVTRSYVAGLLFTIAGNYSIAVKVGKNMADISASPFTLAVAPNVLCASLSIATGQGLTLVTSGISSSFTITARDTFGNDLAESVSPVSAIVSGSGISNFFASSRYLSSGRFVSAFTATVSGNFVVSISLMFGPIQSSPIPFRVTTALACAAKSVVYGNMLSLSTAGSMTRFSICAKDQYSNMLTASTPSFVAVATSPVASIALQVLEISGCEHALFYVPTISGAYSIGISLVQDNGVSISQPIRSSPFSAAVLATTSTPARSIISFVPSAIAGVKAVIAIQSKDIFSNSRTSGSDSLSLRIVDLSSTIIVSAVVADKLNGAYEASFLSTLSGTFSVVASMQTPSGLNGLLNNSGISITISPNVVCASSSVYAVFTAVTAGVSSQFSIFARDRYGNARPGNSSFASLFSAGAQSAVSHVSGNLYGFVSAITTSGVFSVFIKYDSLPIGSSPITLNVLPGFISAATSLVSISSTIVMAGSTLSFRVTSRDMFGNIRSLADTLFDVKATSSTSLTDARLSTSGGVYSFELSMTVAATYQLSITLNGSSVASSPYSVRVDPSVAEISRCILIGNSFAAATAGKTVEFVVQVNDLYSNRITLATPENLLLFIVQVASPKVSFLAARPSRSPESFYEGKFATTVSGYYAVSISFRGKHISNSPFSLEIRPNLVCRTLSYVTSTVLRLTTAGVLSNFSIVALDQFSNQLSNGGLTFLASISPIVTNPVPIQMSVVDLQDGTYGVTFVVTAAGRYSSTVSMCLLDGCLDLGKFPNKSPFRTTVIPDEMQPSSSFLTGEGLTAATAAVDSSFIMNLNDASGNFIGVRAAALLAIGFTSDFASSAVKTVLQIEFSDSSGNTFSVADKFNAMLSSGKSASAALGTVRNEPDGTVKVTYNIKVFGALQMRVLLNGIHVRDSPFNVTVFPLDLIPSPAKSSLATSILPAATAGFPNLLKLTVRNRFGIGMISGNTVSQVFSSLTLGSTSVLLRQIGVSSSVVTIGYVATVAGVYTFSIKIGSTESNSLHISGSPFALHVLPSFSNSEGSIARAEEVKSVVAGSLSNFTIEARDQFSNLQDPSKAADAFSCIFTGPGGAQATQSATRIVGPFYQGQFMATLSGTYEVDVNLFGTSISKSPFTVIVSPSALAVDNSVITQFPTHAVAGSRALLSLSARDTFGNKLAASDIIFHLSAANLAVPLPGPTLVSQSYVGSGDYSVIFVATVAGVYSMTLGLPIGVIQPPFQTTVSPSSASELFSSNLTVLSRTTVAGRSESWLVRARDGYSNAHTSLQSAFLLEFAGPTSGIFPFSYLQNGIYERTSVFTSAGVYSVSILMNSTRAHITGSPFSVRVSPDSAFAQSCASFGSGISSAGAGFSSSFSISSFDMFGNKVTRGGETFFATLQSGTSVVSSSIEDKLDGSYDVTYTITASAMYSLNVLLNGNLTAGSPFNVSVIPHPACVPRLSYQFGSIIPSPQNLNPFGITGDTTFWTIQTVDKFGNNRTSGGDFVAVALAGPSFFNADVQDLENGQYLVVAVINAAGTYTMTTRISGQHIQGSPLRGVQFAAAGAGYDSIITSGNGISSATAGSKLEVFVDASAPAAQKVIGSNKFRVKFVFKATGMSSQPSISSILPSGLHHVQHILTRAGAYSVDVRGELDFRSVANSPFALSVTPGQLFPSACDAIGSGTAGGISGSIVNAFVRLRDEFGNVLPYGAIAEVTAALSTGSAVGVVRILDNDLQVPDFAGFYKITYIVPAAASSLSIFVSSAHIKDSPFSISGVSSLGAVNAQKSFFVGFDLSRPVPASRACTFSLYFRDSAGMNVQQFDSSLLTVSASADNQRVQASLVASFSTFAVLSLAISKVSRSSGGWALAASYNGQSISTTDRFNIFAVDVSPSHSLATSSDQNCSPAGCQARDFFSWEIQATDMFQNVITKSLGSDAVSLSISIGPSPVVSAVLDNQDGSYSMQYTGTVAGTYSVSILLNAAHILGSPFSTKVIAAAPSSTASFLSGSALATMTAGKLSTLFMNVRDSFGNMYDRQLFNLNARFGYIDLSTRVAYTSDGTYEAVFSATFSSTYSLSVSFSPDPLSGASPVGKPTSVNVLSAPVDPSQTVTIGPGLNTFRAGSKQPIYLSAYDAFGNLRSSTVYSDRFLLSFSSSSNEYSAEAVPNEDGTYVHYHASSISGGYIISITNQATAAAVFRSPFSVEVLPGVASPRTSSLSPTAPLKKTIIAGNSMPFGVVARDEFGSLTGCGYAFRVSSQASGQSESVSQSTCSEGVYFSAISPTVTGSLLVNVLIAGEPIVDAPFSVLVSAGRVDPSRCVASGSGLLAAVPGAAASITIQTFDSFGNKCEFDPFGEVVSFVVSFSPSGTFNGPCIHGDANDAHLALETGTYLCVDSRIVNNQDSTYTLYYTPWYSSTYDISISSSGVGIMDSPFGGLKVAPGPAYAQNFNISLTSSMPAGSIFGVSVLVRDAIYNAISSTATAPEAALLRRPVYSEDESDIQTFPFSLSSSLGVFEGSLLVTRAATYALSVSFNKILAGSGTIAVFISPGTISIAACTLSGNVGGGHISSPSSFEILARDVFGNRISTGGETFSIAVLAAGSSDIVWSSDSAGQPVDNSDGTYSVTYSVSRRGSYSVAVSSGSTSVSGSPLAVTFVGDSDTNALSPVAARSKPFGNGLFSAVVNQPSSFDLRLANIQNIYMWSGSFKNDVVVTLNLEFSNFFVPVTVFEKSSNLISFSYTIPTVGSYILSVTLFGDHVLGSPYRVAATPSATVSEMTLVSSNADVSGAAGVRRSFSVSPRDASGNLQRLDPYSGPENIAAIATLQGSASVLIPASFSIQDDGFQIASWTPTIAGIYSLSVMHGLNVVKYLPSISIQPGPVAAATTLVSGAGLGKLYIGSLVGVEIVARDSFGNVISDGQQSFAFQVSSRGNSISSGNAVWNKALLRYTFSYLASSIGALQVSISLRSGSDELSVPGSPFIAESLVGPSCASLSSLVFIGSQMVVGQTLQFKVVTADDFGNPVSVGGNFFRVTVATRSQPFSPSVTDNLDGSYSTSFQLSSAGNISVTAVRNGFHVSGSPFSSIVLPGPASGPRSMISVQTPSLIAGESFRFSLASADRFGNSLSAGGSIVSATLIAASTGAAISVPVSDHLDGTYSGSVPIYLAGSYEFGATLANIPIQSGASFSILVTASSIDRSKSYLSLSLDLVTADNSFVASLSPVDVFGNQASFNGEEVSVSIDGGNAATTIALVYNSASAVFSAAITISKVGSYSIHALLTRTSGSIVSVGSPSNITVIPGADAPENGRLVGAAPSVLNTGEFSSWILQSSDKFQNAVIEADDAFTCVLVCKSGCGSTTVPGVSLGQGRKLFNITGYVAGDYYVHIKLGSKHIVGSPFSVIFLPSAVSVTKSTVSGFALRHAFPGQPTRFQVNLRDRFQNAIKNPSIYNSLQISGVSSFAINYDESCNCALITYTPPSAASFTLTVGYGSDILATSLIDVNNNPQGKFRVRSATGYASPTLTSATGSGLIFATVGQASSFSVVVKDGSDNLLSASVVAALGSSSTLFSQSQLSVGTASLSYVATFSGSFPLSVRLDSGAHVIGSPFTVFIEPSLPSATKSVVTGARTALAGTIYAASLTCFDNFGNLVGVGGFSNLSSSLVGPTTVQGSVMDQFTGTANSQFSVVELGVYRVAFAVRGVEISNTILVEVQPGVVASAPSVVRPLAVSSVVGGEHVEFFVEPRDKFSNIVASSPSFLGRLKGQSATALIETVQSSQPFSAGLHNLKFNVTVAGQYSLTVSYIGSAIQNSPILFQVVPSSVSHKHSLVAGLGIVLSVRGAQSSFSVTLRDSFLNILTETSLYQQVQASLESRGSENSVGIIEHNSAGKLSISASAVFFFDGTFGYSLPMDGQFTLDVKFSGVHLFGSPFKVKSIPAQSPRVISSMFTDTVSGITIQFDVPTNQASMALPGPCSQVFTSETIAFLSANPADAMCSWSSATLLNVFLGFGATIVAGQRISFVPGAITIQKSEFPTGSGRFFISSHAVSVSVAVDRPKNPPAPIPIIKSPSLVSACDVVVLDASSSAGSGGRPLQFIWGVLPAPINDADIRSFLRGFYNKPVASLPASLLPPGHSYSFMVRVTNFLDVSTDALVSIQKVASSLPTVVIESGSSRSVDSSSVQRIKAQVKPSVCGPSSSSFAFEWKWLSVSPAGPLPLLDQETVFTPQLYIEKDTLIPGRTYVLGFYARPSGSNSSVGFSKVTLVAKPAPILAVIDGGHRVVSVTDDIVLDASRSIDFDHFSRSNFSYSWSCLVGGLPCFPTAAALFEQDVEILRIPFSHLSPGSYDFQLTVTKDTRSHSVSSTITVTRGSPTRVGISPITKAKLNADDKITLQSISFEPSGTVVSFEWSQISGENVLYVSSTNRSRGVDRVRSALDAPMLVLSQFALQPGQSYGFRLTGQAPGQQLGVADIFLQINAPPASGSFTVTPSSGRALMDTFSLKCSYWEDSAEDLPLKYEFRYLIMGSVDEIPILSTDKNAYDLVMPLAAAGAQTRVIAYIFDSWGASSRVQRVLNISVAQGGRRLLASQAETLKQKIASALAVGSCEDFLGALSALASLPGASVCPYAASMRVCSAKPPASAITTALHSVKSLIDAAEGSCSKEQESAMVSVMTSLSASASAAGAGISSLGAKSMVGALGSMVSGGGSSEGSKVSDSVGSLADALTSNQVAGEDSPQINSGSLALAASKASASDLNSGNAVLGCSSPGAASFATPPGMLEVVDGASVSTVAAAYATSPFASSRSIGSGVSSLSFSDGGGGSVPVEGLAAPIVLMMPLTAAPSGNSSSRRLLMASGDGTVETCRYFNHNKVPVPDWDGEGCIAVGFDAGQLVCHCFHLTEFGSANDQVVPEMNTPDPVGDAKLFTQINMSNALALIFVSCLFFVYCVSMWLGWRADNRETDAKLNPSHSASAQPGASSEVNVNDVLNSGDFLMMKRLFRGNIAQKLQLLRQKFFDLVSQEHLFLSCVWKPRNSVYTRPRRITVLFCIVIGNMAVGGLFAGTGQTTILQTIMAGVISSLLMFPPSFIFAYLFRNIGLDRRAALAVSQDNLRQQEGTRAVIADSLTLSNKGDSTVLPPPEFMRTGAPAPRPKDLLPSPDVPTFRGVAPAASRLDNGKSGYRRVAATSSELDAEVQEGGTGTYIPRRALPMSSSPTPRATSYAVAPPRSAPSAARSAEPAHLGDREMVAMAETADTSKDPLAEATGIMRFVYKGSEAALRAISSRQTASKRQQPLPSPMVIVAYTMAGLWMLIAMYFSIIFGLKFPSAQSRSWVMAFGISLIQDMVVQQSIRVAAKTTISLVVMPRIAAFLAGRILNAYKKPQASLRKPAAAAE